VSETEPYIRKVHYYETDKMGIVHHSNYIRWMEEARVDLMARTGYPYERMEAAGVFSPVMSVACEYKRPCAFGDEIAITAEVTSLGGASMELRYEMKNAKTGETVCVASSKHAFIDGDGRIVRLKKAVPDFYSAMEKILIGE